MYEQFFGLNESPFQLSPDPFFMYPSVKSREALGSIAYAVARRKGFVVMTGEVGTGKTMVLRALFELWQREETPFAYFIGPKLSTNDFLSYITFELGIHVKDATKGSMLRALYGFVLTQFEKGRTTILIIDEAHQMPRTVLEEIRVLTNFETAQQKLIQVVLVGQPELDERLDLAELRSLKQRIAVRCRLEPLGQDEIRPYVERRLEVAGADSQATSIFPDRTIEAVYRYSGGIPRLVNSICDQALMAASKRQVRTVSAEIINEVGTHFRLDPTLKANQAEKPSSLARKASGPIAGKSKEIPGAANIPATKDLDPESPSTAVMGSAATPVQTAPTTKEERAHKNGHRMASEKKTGLARLGRGLTSHGSWTSQIRRWLQPGLRLSMVVVAAGLLPVALAAGFLMAHRQKVSTRPPQEVTGISKPLMFAQTARPLQPTAISAKPTAIDSAGPIAPGNDRSASKPIHVENATSPVKILIGRLSRPNLASRPHSTPVPPAIFVTQPKQLDVVRDLLQSSAPLPPTATPNAPMLPANASPSASNGAHQLQPARLISGPPPAYPAIALGARVGGAVVIDAAIDEEGRVTDMKVISGPSLLINAAMEALHRWKYEPARLNGRPIATRVQVRINFQLQ